MYTGTLIDDLISSVERAEKYSHQVAGSDGSEPGILVHTNRWQSSI